VRKSYLGNTSYRGDISHSIREKQESKLQKDKKDEANKNNYEYICLNIRNHSELFNYIREKKWEYRVISDIKKEIKSNNNIESEFKNFYISVPKDDIQRIKTDLDDGNKLKRKRREIVNDEASITGDNLNEKDEENDLPATVANNMTETQENVDTTLSP